MTDLSISDLTNYWDGFQEDFDDWYDDRYWYGWFTQSYYCGQTEIIWFCRSHFSSDDCETYCVNNNYCSLYWTKQAKVCCSSCAQTCTSMGESVHGECSSTTTTSMTTTTEDHVSTITFPTSNGTSYTKQPFGKSPLISAGLQKQMKMIC